MPQVVSRGSFPRIGACWTRRGLSPGKGLIDQGMLAYISLAVNSERTGEDRSLQDRKHPEEGLLVVGRPQSLFDVVPAQAEQVGARLLRFQHVWAASINDFWVVKTVSTGRGVTRTFRAPVQETMKGPLDPWRPLL